MSGYCPDCGNQLCVCGEPPAPSRDRDALENLVEYCLNASFITASRAREILGFPDMETLREWRSDMEGKKIKKELITLDNIIVLP